MVEIAQTTNADDMPFNLREEAVEEEEVGEYTTDKMFQVITEKNSRTIYTRWMAC